MDLLFGEISQYHFEIHTNYLIAYNVTEGGLQMDFSTLLVIFTNKRGSHRHVAMDMHNQYKLMHNTQIRYLEHI